jgi:methionyl-tRNA synthetase
MTTSLVTTAIPYVNASPHLGFAYELVLADVLARHRRRRGRDVRFVTGTDDNSLKNVVAAAQQDVTPRELVDTNTRAFAELGPLLGVAADDFVRTSIDGRHRAAVAWLWRACRHDLYRRTWQGRYCAGCEAFVDDDVAICAEHGVAPEPVAEENWFFRLSRWREPVRDAIATGRLAIVPEAARAETLAFLDGDVRDLSVSRVASRSAGWGIGVPDDPGQVIYVWFDALANYLASLDLGGDRVLYDRYWKPERVHVIGKGITRFHAVYWPAFLLSAGLPLPDRIFVHGYLTVDGEKIRKTGKNVAVPPVVARWGVDALRWYFARKCRTRSDGDVALDAIGDAYDTDLADRLGNLVQRTVKLAAGRAPGPAHTADAARLLALASALAGKVDAALDDFALDAATAAIVEALDAANRYVDDVAPWRLSRTDPAAARASLHAPLGVARTVAGELAPFVPGVSRAILDRLGELVPGAPLPIGSPPLPRLRA